MKTVFIWLLFGLSLLLLGASVSFTAGGRTYHELIVTREEYDLLRSSRSETEEGLLRSVSFDEAPLFYNSPDGEWFYSRTGKADPVVSHRGSVRGVRLAFSDVFSTGGAVPFLAYTDDSYQEYTLVSTTLPLIRIECDEEFYTVMDHTADSFPGSDIKSAVYPMRFTLIDNRPERLRSTVISEGTVHVRGGSTMEFPKKNLRISLLEKSVGKDMKEYTPDLLGLRQDGDWLLYSAYNDQEKVRNVFSSNLWIESCAFDNRFGLKNGMEYRFVELFFNDRYWGLYALGYPVDAKQMNIKPDIEGHYDEFLFKQKAFGPNDIGSDGIILQFEADESDQNNGVGIMGMYFEMIKQENPAAFWHNDADNILDIWLFLKLGQAYDTIRIAGQSKNLFYTIKMTDAGRIILFTPWDADNYWGNVWSKNAKNKTIPYGLDPDDNTYENTVNPISYLRRQDDAYNRMIQTRYEELRADGWSDAAVDGLIDGYERDIFGSGAYWRDMRRWPEGTYQDPDLGLSLFREYVHKRLDSMDGYIENLSDMP